MYGHQTITAARSMAAYQQRTPATPVDRRAALLGWAGAAGALVVSVLLLASLPTLAAAPSSGAQPAPLPAPSPIVPAD